MEPDRWRGKKPAFGPAYTGTIGRRVSRRLFGRRGFVTAATEMAACSIRPIRGSQAAMVVGSPFAAAPYGVREDGSDEHDIDEISHEASARTGFVIVIENSGAIK